jgi:hypothetical protein
MFLVSDRETPILNIELKVLLCGGTAACVTLGARPFSLRHFLSNFGKGVAALQPLPQLIKSELKREYACSELKILRIQTHPSSKFSAYVAHALLITSFCAVWASRGGGQRGS